MELLRSILPQMSSCTELTIANSIWSSSDRAERIEKRSWNRVNITNVQCIETNLLTDLGTISKDIGQLTCRQIEVDEIFLRKLDLTVTSVQVENSLTVREFTSDMQYEPWEMDNLLPKHYIPIPRDVKILHLEKLRPESMFIAEQVASKSGNSLETINITMAKTAVLTSKQHRNLHSNSEYSLTKKKSTTALKIWVEIRRMQKT